MSWQQLVNEILNFILSPPKSDWFLTIKNIFLAFGLFFFGYTIWALTKTSWLEKAILIDLKEIIRYRPYFVKSLRPKWQKIEKRLERGLEAEFKLAVLEADELLDECLTKMGYREGKIEEKLEKLTEDIVENLEELKKIRQVKIHIIEDPSFKLTLEETKKILQVYQKSLEDLQAI